MEQQAEKPTQENRFVVNASVSLLWFLRDEPPDLCYRADLLFQDILDGRVVIHVPDRWLDEVCGGLVKAVHAKRLSRQEAREALHRVFRMIVLPNWQIHYSDLHWRHEEVAEWAMATSLSFYDAIYLFVAEKVGAVFWTADRKLYEFLRQSSNPRAQWIGNYQPFSQ
jgi:predicted nucleic acid-binding protein